MWVALHVRLCTCFCHCLSTQNIMTPLLDQLSELGEADEARAPTKRLAIIQVLTYKLTYFKNRQTTCRVVHIC